MAAPGVISACASGPRRVSSLAIPRHALRTDAMRPQCSKRSTRRAASWAPPLHRVDSSSPACSGG
jgi:hypothetical protein